MKTVVLGSAGLELIFTRSWLSWPKQPIKWDILYRVMSCSVFKWGCDWRRGFCYSGASWAWGGENTACCICFLSVLLIVVFFSLCHSVKLFSSQPTSFAFFLLILLLIPSGREEEWESNCVVLCCKLRQNHNTTEMVCLTEVQRLAVSSVERVFTDSSQAQGGQFDLSFVITEFCGKSIFQELTA